jgi:hypothetical protein
MEHLKRFHMTQSWESDMCVCVPLQIWEVWGELLGLILCGYEEEEEDSNNDSSVNQLYWHCIPKERASILISNVQEDNSTYK